MINIKKLFYLLTPYERTRAFLLLIMMTMMALLDMLGVASILPFTAVLANPTLIETNYILKSMFQTFRIFGVENNQQFLFILGVFVFVLLVISLAFKALTTYAQVRFVEMREFSISKRLVEGYLHQPYEWFLSSNSADLGKTILSEVQQLITYGIRPFTELFAKGMVTLALISLLIFTNPILALIIGIFLGGTYALIFYFLRGYLNRIGKRRLKNNQLRFITVSEAFGATKEVKVGGLEKVYIDNFSSSAQAFAKTQASSQVIGQLPRFILEGIAFGGVLLIILYLMSQEGSFNNALPVLSLYVFAGYRLMPALQQLYGSLTQLTFIGPTLDKINEDLKNLKQSKLIQDEKIISFNKSIALKNIYYSYPNHSREVLKNINLTISVKSTVGFVGATGSGKTTVVDIILGLLKVQKGSLEVDGQIITNQNLRAWQSLIGYVPQHIYLSDNSIAANIAFGENPEKVNQETIEKVAKIANIHDFIISELPKKYQTTIGERGIKLSGGQRQRIGIARALYNNPQILILDEATSALDNQTEQAVMDAVNNLSKNITIILIAHRINTLKKCDVIFKLENSRLIGQGSYDKILRDNSNSSN